MTGLKLSRIRKCQSCPYWRSAPALYWKWPRCVYAQELELSSEFMEGPSSNCPAGYWDGLDPVDLDELRREGAQRMAEHQAKQYAPLLAIALKGQPKEEVAERLETMVAEGLLLADAAAEIALEIAE
jgi:hypothetical protein